MQTPSDSGDQRARSMRKGTHSCLLCRKRKIRCIWPPSSESCYGCIARKALCVEQTYGAIPKAPFPKTKRMRQRIAELESTIGQIVRRLDGLGIDTAEILHGVKTDTGAFNSGGDVPSTFTKLRISEDLSTDLDNAPLLALLDNEVLYSEKVLPTHTGQYPRLADDRSGVHMRYSSLLRALRPLIPSAQAVALILRESHLSVCLLGKNFREVQRLGADLNDPSFLEALGSWIIDSLKSDNVATLSKALVCLATCIQQLPRGTELASTNLETPLEILCAQYIEFAGAFLEPDEGIAGSYDGLDCQLAQVRFYLNGGLPRKAWVVFRRAVTFAQLIEASNRYDMVDPVDPRRFALWLQLWQIDRNLSLLLGLPYMIPIFPLKMITGTVALYPTSPQLSFVFALGELAGRVIDRNVQGRMSNPYSDSLKMDEAAERSKSMMPATWWDHLPGPEMPIEAVYEMFTLKFWYYSLRNLIHLPYVLRCSSNPQYQYSTYTAIQASREMIRCYNVLRDVDRPVLRLCNAVDFQTLTAALIITISLISSASAYDTEQKSQDWDMIQSLIDLMYHTAEDLPDSVAAQGARLLEDLSKLRDNSAESHESFHAVVPYFGEIRIRKRNPGYVAPSTHPEQGLSTSSVPYQSVASSRAAVSSEENFQLDDLYNSFFSFNEYVATDNSQAWPEADQQWAPAVGFSLQDDWDWELDDVLPL